MVFFKTIKMGLVVDKVFMVSKWKCEMDNIFSTIYIRKLVKGKVIIG
jgi:hypothetical protein